MSARKRRGATKRTDTIEVSRGQVLRYLEVTIAMQAESGRSASVVGNEPGERHYRSLVKRLRACHELLLRWGPGSVSMPASPEKEGEQ